VIQSLRPATVVSPGILSRELARGWTQKDLAEIIGRPIQTIKLFGVPKQVTPETALELADAFNTSPEFWMNLEANYRLHFSQEGKEMNWIWKEMNRRLFGRVACMNSHRFPK